MTGTGNKRAPQVFTPDDPDLVVADPSVTSPDESAVASSPGEDAARETAATGLPHHIRWGALLVSAAAALASLAFTLWFARFVSIALSREDWIGWVALSLMGIIALSGGIIVLRELVGFYRLRRLGRVRTDAEHALATRDIALERHVVQRIAALLATRPEVKWPLARLAEHARDVRDPGDLLRLADRDVLLPLDGAARRAVAGAARRISVVTALSPVAFLTVGWVLVENLRLLRALAGLYGGRPGFFATARLARLVFLHIVATGGIALTDDLLGQFLGQDLVRRLSRRLGESIFNGALTARVGAAAIAVIRPLPFIEAPPVRARDFIAELTRRRRTDDRTRSGSGSADTGKI